MKLSRFTPQGLELFGKYLDELEQNPAGTPPLALLEAPECLRVLDSEIEVVPHRFKTRWAAATYLNSLFATSGMAAVEGDVHLWACLSAFYFDVLCPAGVGGVRRVRERAAYIPEPANYKRYYRHLLLGPYLIYRAHASQPERALSMLCRPLHIISDIEGQIAARQEFVTNPSVVQLATHLYYDPKTQTTRPGAGGKGPGSPRRLVNVLDQFGLTRDLYAVTAEELDRLMPREFDRFRS